MKRFISAILAVACMLLLLPIAAYALDSQPSTLTVVTKYGDTALSGINIAVYRVANAREENGTIVYDAMPAFSGIGADFAALAAALAVNKSIALDSILEACKSSNSTALASKVTDSDGKAAFPGLTAGLYLAVQANAENSSYLITSVLIAVPNPNTAGGGWCYDVVACPKTEPIRPNGESISVRVYKIWKGTDNPPGFIWVQLYKNGNAHGSPVSLNAANFWNHTWHNLDSREAWTVDEPSVPDGYTKSISGSVGSGFVITNTRNGGSSGTTPTHPFQTTKSSGGSNGKGPKTDDGSNMRLWIALILASSVGLLATIWILARVSKRRAAA